MIKTMRKLSIFHLLLLPALLFMTSCEDDISADDASIETPVVVALLDKADAFHYVKITRSFGGFNNALEVAQIADSSYYQSIDVKIEEWTPVSSSNGTLVKRRTWTLRDTLLGNKEPGAFYFPTQKVYYFETEVYNSSNPPASADGNLDVALKPDATYRLVATINGGEYVVNAETKMIEDVSITYPLALGQYTFANYDNGGTFQSYAVTNTKANIGTSNKSARVLDARIKISFEEYFNGVPQEKSFVWKLGELTGDQITESNVVMVANGQTFYNLMKQNVTNDPTIDKRRLTKMELTMTGGTEELSKYILVNKPNSSLAQNKPIYTNVSCSDGRQALGIFSTRSKSIQLKQETSSTRAISKNSMIGLCTGAVTGDLLFCSGFAADNTSTYYCD